MGSPGTAFRSRRLQARQDPLPASQLWRFSSRGTEGYSSLNIHLEVLPPETLPAADVGQHMSHDFNPLPSTAHYLSGAHISPVPVAFLCANLVLCVLGYFVQYLVVWSVGGVDSVGNYERCLIFLRDGFADVSLVSGIYLLSPFFPPWRRGRAG